MNPQPELMTMRPADPTGAIAQSHVVPRPLANPDPLALLIALRRRVRLAVGLAALAAALAATAAYIVVPPAKYTAQAMLHVAAEQPRILVKTAESQSEYSSYQRTQLAMLRSRLVLGTALKRPEIAQSPTIKQQVEPVEWLDKQLKIDFAESSEILRISLSGIDPVEPAKLVNAVVQAYLDEVVNVEVSQRRERADMLKEVWNRYQENLRSKRDEVRRLSMTAGSDDKQALAVLRHSEAEQLAKADAELSRTRDEMRRLRIELDVAQRSQAANQTSPVAIADVIARDPTVATLSSQADRARSKYDQLRRATRDAADPSVLAAAQAYEAARAMLEARRAQARPAAIEQVTLQSRTSGPNLAALGERIEVLEGLESLQAEDVKRLMDRGRTMTQASVDLNATREEIFHADELARRIGGEVEALNLELRAPARIRLRERAETSRSKDELRQIKASGAAAVGAFALALFGVSFWEFHARRVASPDDLRLGLGVRVVGTLPLLPKGRQLDARRGKALQNLMIESVDSTRASLIHAGRDQPIRVIMVGSAEGGEGKTSLACHLAASLARSGRQTLLIDCDLRRPSAHRVLDLPGEIGVSEILRGEADLGDAIMTTSATNLWFLPAGICDAEALQGLSRDEIGSLFAILRQRFDYIVVDTPPILPVADALMIGQHVDAVLFAVMRDVSRMPKVQAAYDRLASLGIRMLGAIVAGARTETYGGQYEYAAQRQA